MEHEQPAEIRTVAIIGLGLIGGSLARDLSARGIRVYAWDHDTAAISDAMRQGIAEPVFWNEPLDAVVLALPVLVAREYLVNVVEKLAERMDAVRLITDVGSTKRSIVRFAEGLGIGDRFVGSHPLAGDHRSGWNASREGLFAGARVYLCPTSSTRDDALRLTRELWTMVDARPEEIDAADHDQRLALTSHLPQLVSSALGGALASQGIARAELGPGGRDVTRLAGSSPAMWADIAYDNADMLVPALDMVEAWLHEIRDGIAQRRHARLRELLAAAQAWHQQAP